MTDKETPAGRALIDADLVPTKPDQSFSYWASFLVANHEQTIREALTLLDTQQRRDAIMNKQKESK